jgi:tRNA pseudouridine55 synthase
MRKPYDGIILMDKEVGKTSFDVVKQVKHFSWVKKLGHAGTLDPFATGLLILMLGEGTKLSPYLTAGEKVYQATMRLGVETDTLDLTGQVVKRRNVPELGTGFLEQVARGFVGEIEQTPPQFSAVKFDGKRAHSFAREGIQIALRKRKVKIRSLKISSVDLPDVAINVTCSSGTYIRSLAADLGRRLGPGAHLVSLRRLRSGPFDVKDALALEELESLTPDAVFREKLIPVYKALPDMLEMQVDDVMARKIRNGYQPQHFPRFSEGYLKLAKGEDLVAIGKVEHPEKDQKSWFKIVRVFNYGY